MTKKTKSTKKPAAPRANATVSTTVQDKRVGFMEATLRERIDWHESAEGKRAVLAIAKQLSGDGHGIYSPDLLIECGMPGNIAASYAVQHKADGSHKGSIYTDRGMVRTLTGVWSLDFYRRVCSVYSIDTGTHFIGRGSEARELHRRLMAFLNGAGTVAEAGGAA